MIDWQADLLANWGFDSLVTELLNDGWLTCKPSYRLPGDREVC